MINATDAADCYDRRGVLRPARDEEQAGYFKESAARHADQTQWLPAGAVAASYPGVAAPFGALRIYPGGVVDTPRFLEALIAGGIAKGLELSIHTRLVAWSEIDGHVAVVVRTGAGDERRVTAARLVLTLGAGVSAFEDLQDLDLHAIKGQIVQLGRPAHLAREMIPLSGYGYVIDAGDTLIAGSSYEHRFVTAAPTHDVALRLRAEAARLIPALSGMEILGSAAGIRMTVPRLRLPMVGPLPGHDRVWIVSGLGSKGLLMAPMIANAMATYFADPDCIPHPMKVRVKSP